MSKFLLEEFYKIPFDQRTNVSATWVVKSEDRVLYFKMR